MTIHAKSISIRTLNETLFYFLVLEKKLTLAWLQLISNFIEASNSLQLYRSLQISPLAVINFFYTNSLQHVFFEKKIQ
jgi:hypothetical protein